jgi:Ca-activated chloride channel family protein
MTLPLEARYSGNAQAKLSGNPSARATAEKKTSFDGEGSGTLIAMSPTGKRVGQCPLKHTDVKAKISGYVSHVTVKQTFHNPYDHKIEAVYTFPLSETAAVDDMVMKVGSRIVRGTIKKKEEAKEIYDRAKEAGHVASLLDQERPNIFTQSVANIEPGKEVEITIQYIDLLPYDDGKYTFNFPTVVGPRFIPGTSTGSKSGTGRVNDTDRVGDASKITPPVTPKGTRAGHDISIYVDIDAGVSLSNLKSELHEVSVNNPNASHASVSLMNKSTIPNKDFVLSWDVAGDKLKSGYLTYREPKLHDGSGYFTLMLLPPKRVTPDTVAPKEMVFLIDCSGSQSGPPLEKAKETLSYIIDHMNAKDTFQIIAFSDTQKLLFNEPQQSSEAMRAKAKKFINGLDANGGTWMAEAITKLLTIPADDHRLRIVTFMTDGYVGNDMEILGLINKSRDKSRWFSFGTGNGVNRFLIDGIAKEGGGEAEYVLLNSKGDEVGKKFYQRIASPVLTDVKVSFDGVEVKEVFPKNVNDVWAQKPLYIKGRYTKAGAGTITLSGYQAGKPYKQTMQVNFPEDASTNKGVASIWARAKVDRLMSEDWMGAQSGNPKKEIKDEIIRTALDHHIMTNYTSFVAVEEKTVTKNGKLQTVAVPIEMVDGVSQDKTIETDELSRAPGGGFVGGGGGAGGPAVMGRLSKRKAYNKQASYLASPSAMPPPPAPIFAGSFGSSADGAAPAPTRAWSGASSQAQSVPLEEKKADYLAAPEPRPKATPKPEAKDKKKEEGALIAHASKLDGKLLVALKGNATDRLDVKVTLNLNKPVSAELLKLLKQAGLTDIKTIATTGQTKVTGKITAANLRKLIALAQVYKVEAAN